MERAGHEGIVIGRVAEYYELRAAQRFSSIRTLRGELYDLAHLTNRVHIDAGLRRSYIDRAAKSRGNRKCLGDRIKEDNLLVGHALGNDRAVAADQVHSDAACRLIESLRDLNIICGCFASGSSDRRDRSNRDTLVYYRNTVALRNMFSDFHKASCLAADLIVNVLA